VKYLILESNESVQVSILCKQSNAPASYVSLPVDSIYIRSVDLFNFASFTVLVHDVLIRQLQLAVTLYKIVLVKILSFCVCRVAPTRTYDRSFDLCLNVSVLEEIHFEFSPESNGTKAYNETR
jgi:hypothetical protein